MNYLSSSLFKYSIFNIPKMRHTRRTDHMTLISLHKKSLTYQRRLLRGLEARLEAGTCHFRATKNTHIRKIGK